MEPLRGYLMLAERLFQEPTRFATGWNFGPVDDDAKPVSWIADELARLWGSGASWTYDINTHPREAHALKLDASRAKSSLGWKPAIPLHLALQWITKWYRGFQAGEDLARLTQAQIADYETLVQGEVANATVAGGASSHAHSS
jgi:CDP-glucose 4,6-dehydratase